MALDPSGYSLLCAVVCIPCFCVPTQGFGMRRLITLMRMSVVTTCQLQKCPHSPRQWHPCSPGDSGRQCKASPSAEGQSWMPPGVGRASWSKCKTQIR